MDITPFQDPHGAFGKLLCAKVWSLGESGRVSAVGLRGVGARRE